jgi:protein phosphatase
MEIRIPEFSLVVLIGASAAGKSTFARKHFLATEVVSSDHCRALVSDDENDQSATADAFELLHLIVAKRLKAGRLTVVDATNVQPEARKPLLALARQYHCPAVALVLDMPESLCAERHAARADRSFGEHVIPRQRAELERSLQGLQREGFRRVHVLRSQDELDAVSIRREPLWNNKRSEHGPFDIIGDVHGCIDELLALLNELGYEVARRNDDYAIAHPQGRKLVFVGDLVDRGPHTPEVVRLAMSAVAQKSGYCVAGNHDMKLIKALRGHDVKPTHGLAESLAQLAAETPEFRARAAEFLARRVDHYVFDDGKLVVAHAGLREDMQGRSSGRVRQFALYGDTTGEADEYGLPVRRNWAADYHGRAMVVYGHTPVPEAEWQNNTICLDTGCVFGGKLTALRYPEKALVSVPARACYYAASRPIQAMGGASRETRASVTSMADGQARENAPAAAPADCLTPRKATD